MIDSTAYALADALRDRYLLERELGRGGMATVYLARDLKHDRQVAVKVLRPDLAAVLGGERFLREIRLTAQLQHPHILSLIDSGEAAGFLYYVMPYIEGESLRARLVREGQLPIEDALAITRAVAGALDYAHGLGVIHRDVKPENILLHRGEPMVADFGVALAAASAGRERLTETGLSLGTPAYMSPEQAGASPRLDGRSDQYSLACVLFEMLAGEPPYTGPTAQAIIAKRFSEPVPHLSTLRAVPPAVEAAVTRALAKSPADRFSTVADFTAALAHSPRTPLLSRRMAAVLGGIATLMILGLLAFLLRPHAAAGPMATRQLTFSGKAGELSLSPDGKSVAYVSGKRSLVVQSLAGGEPLVLVPPARFLLSPRWTRDGATIVFEMFRDSTELAATYAIPASGGSARKVVEDFVPMDTGPDSGVLVRAPRQKHRLDFIDLRDGRTLRAVLLPDSLAEPADVAWSPNGRFIALHVLGAIWTIPAAGGRPTRIVGSRARSNWSMRWGLKSDALYYLDGPSGSEGLFRIRIDRRSGAGRGESLRVAALPGAGAFDLRAGRLVYAIERTDAQARVFVYGGTPRRVVADRLLTEGSATVSGTSISGDGNWIAYSQDRGGDQNIYVVPFSGGSPRAIASTSASESMPRWSPDGSRLAFTREDSGGRVVMVANVASGISQRASAVAGPFANLGPGWALWAADSRHLAFYVRDLRSAVMVDLQRQSEREASLPDSIGTGYVAVIPSPDGRYLVASTIVRQTDWGELWGGSESQPWQRLRGPFGESWPIAFGQDGWIYLQNERGVFTDYGAIHSEIWRMRASGAGAEFFAPVPDGCAWVDLAADGRRGACPSGRTESDLFVASNFDSEPAGD